MSHWVVGSSGTFGVLSNKIWKKGMINGMEKTVKIESRILDRIESAIFPLYLDKYGIKSLITFIKLSVVRNP